MTTPPIILPVEPLTAQAFAPFGDVIEASEAARNFPINRGFAQRYHDLARIDVASENGHVVVSIFRAAPRSLPLKLELLERHPLGTQAFMPLSQHPYLVVVAMSATASSPDLSALRCFHARFDQGVNYARGTWHHPLLALVDTSNFLVIDRGGSVPDGNCEELMLKEQNFLIAQL